MQKKRKKKYRIRWGRVAMLLAAIAICVTIIYYIGVGVGSLYRWVVSPSADSQPDSINAVVADVSPEKLRESQLMTHRIDSFMHQPMRLDTNLIALSVFDATTQQQVYAYHDTQLLAPASCMKVATALAAIKYLGFDHHFHEALLVRGDIRRDTLVGTLLLQADGDPLFTDLSPLVRKMRSRGIRHIRGQVMVSLAREDTLRAHPTGKLWDIPYNKTPLLLKGKRYVERQLLATLRMSGVTYQKDATVRPRGKYRYAAASSHAMRDVITPMLIHSSNIKADALFYHLDWKAGLCPDRKVNWNIQHQSERVLRRIFSADSTEQMKGFVINDGSGLSPDNRLTASFLVDLLRYAYADKQIFQYFKTEALASPASERRGSLLSRMSNPEYKDRIFVKTGTLTTVGGSSLAGYLEGGDGHWYIFSIINSDSPVAESRIFQDKLCKMMMKKTLTPALSR